MFSNMGKKFNNMGKKQKNPPSSQNEEDVSLEDEELGLMLDSLASYEKENESSSSPNESSSSPNWNDFDLESSSSSTLVSSEESDSEDEEDDIISPPYAVKPIEPLRGFFHPFYKDRKANVSVLEEARKILDAVAKLHEQFYYQKIYFTCAMNLAMANDVDKANKKGERLTRARKHYHHANREAELMMTVEKLLATSEYQHLRSFCIAPLSTCAKPGGEGVITEDINRAQLQNIKEKLDQGHAVFCLTDESSWHAEKPLSMIEEKLSIKKEEEITFPPALHQLTQETLIGFQRDYPIPEAVLNGLREDKDLNDAIKDITAKMYVPLIEKKEPVDKWIAALTDAHLLKTWPLQFQGYFRIGINEHDLLKAVTVKQKQALILKRISEVATPKELNKFSPPPKETLFYSEALQTSARELARKYATKIKAYLVSHPFSKEQLEKTYSADVASDINRVKLAKILQESLVKVYAPKTEEDRFDTKDFFDIVDSAESYAVELRGTHSELQTILDDMAWEARLLKNADEKVVEEEPASDRPLDSINLVDEDGIKQNPTGSKLFMSRFRAANDEGKVNLLKSYVASEFEKIYGKDNADEGIFITRIDNSKQATAKRITGIKTNDLYQYWVILIAEFRGQESQVGFTNRMLQETLAVLEQEFPVPTLSLVRHFAVEHATQLLKYINERERSLSYQWGTAYTKEYTRKHIEEAGRLAHAMLEANTPEELERIILKASSYKQMLLKRPTSAGESESRVHPDQKHSDLIPKLAALEKDFNKVFRHRFLVERKSIDEDWQEAFGGAYLDKKYAVKAKGKLEIKAEDKLQKRCYDLGKEMKGNDVYKEVRMCALLNAMGASKYPQIVGRRVREKVGADVLDRHRHQYPAVYYAQNFLARMDEVKTERDQFKQKIETSMKEFFTEGKHTLIELNDKIRGFIEDIKKERAGDFSRFFVSSNLQKFLEDYNKDLEGRYPEVAKHVERMAMQARREKREQKLR